jgi:hypothetical protein
MSIYYGTLVFSRTILVPSLIPVHFGLELPEPEPEQFSTQLSLLDVQGRFFPK